MYLFILNLWNSFFSVDFLVVFVNNIKIYLLFYLFFVKNKGLFVNATVFFLLGDVLKPNTEATTTATNTTVPNAKQSIKKQEIPTSTSTSVAASESPVLTKLILKKKEVFYIEKELRKMKDLFVIATKNKDKTMLLQIFEKIGDLFVVLVYLLQNLSLPSHVQNEVYLQFKETVENKKIYSKIIVEKSNNNNANKKIENKNNKLQKEYKIIENKASTGIENFYILEIQIQNNNEIATTTTSNSNVVFKNINERFLDNFANVFCVEANVDNLLENEISSLLRLALGYFD
jgi:hypothetical protein